MLTNEIICYKNNSSFSYENSGILRQFFHLKHVTITITFKLVVTEQVIFIYVFQDLIL